jgi:hypothetical protein
MNVFFDNSGMLTVSNIISTVAGLVLTIIGVFGNLAGCFILSKQKFKSHTPFHYFYINCVLSLIIITYIWGHFIPIFFDIEWINIYCKTYFYFGNILLQFNPWINVLNSIDRLFSLKYPTKFLIRKQFKYHIILIFIIVLIAFLINIPFIIYEGKNVNYISSDFHCSIENELASYLISGTNFIISCLVPFCIMLTSTTLIIQYLVQQKKIVIPTSVTSQQRSNSKREKEFAKSTLTMDLWFFICYSPLNIADVMQYILNEEELNSSLYRNLRVLASVLSFIEVSCSTYVLLLCNKVFRNEFKFKICKCFFQNQVRTFDS